MKPRHSLCLRDKDDTRPITARERSTELGRIGVAPWIAAAAVADLAERLQAQSCLPTVTCPRMTSLPGASPVPYLVFPAARTGDGRRCLQSA